MGYRLLTPHFFVTGARPKSRDQAPSCWMVSARGRIGIWSPCETVYVAPSMGLGPALCMLATGFGMAFVQQMAPFKRQAKPKKEH